MSEQASYEQSATHTKMRTNLSKNRDRREVEVTLLGSSLAIQGMEWPAGTDSRHLSTGLKIPTNLTIRLPDGKILNLQTRPILIVRRIMSSDRIGMIKAPPSGDPGSLGDKLKQVKRLLDDWGAIPNKRMQSSLKVLVDKPDVPAGMGASFRLARARLDDRSSVAFQFFGTPDGKWQIVAEISATTEAWMAIKEEAAQNRK